MLNLYGWLAVLAIWLGSVLGCWIWGDVHGHSVTKAKYTALIAKADSDRQKSDNQKITVLQNDYDNLSKDQDGDIAYGIDEHKKRLAAEKKHPLPADCVLPDDVLQLYNASGKRK